MNNKSFWNTKMSEMSIGQSFLWLLLYLIFIVVVMIAMIMVPQNADEIWDWCEDKVDKIKDWILKMKDRVSKKEH